MKNIYKLVVFTLLLITLSAIEVMSQNASTAVMDVRVEVITGSSIERNDSVTMFDLVNEITSYGEFTINLPEGAAVIASSEDLVLLESGHESFKLNCSLNVIEKTNNSMSFSFSTSGNGDAERGLYKGVQVATIEYL
jgi:hypothetical protein